MFTGIVEEVGTVSRITHGAHSAVLAIEAQVVTADVHVGDSIAVNGVCLTVTQFDRTGFCADVMHETLNRSSLGDLRGGSLVNLERAMAAGGRFGGHLVSGHIDGTGVIARVTPDDNAVWYRITADAALLRYVVEKGSIAIDGISLTVARVDEAGFEVSLIPHTRSHTNLASKAAGDKVNLECDIVGKYVEKLLGLDDGTTPSEKGLAGAVARAGHDAMGGQGSIGERGANAGDAGVNNGKNHDLTWEFLAENGF